MAAMKMTPLFLVPMPGSSNPPAPTEPGCSRAADVKVRIVGEACS